MTQLDRIEVKLDLLLVHLGIKVPHPKPGDSVPVVVPNSAGDPTPPDPPGKP